MLKSLLGMFSLYTQELNPIYCRKHFQNSHPDFFPRPGTVWIYVLGVHDFQSE